MQAAGEPVELQKLEARRRAVMDKGDLEAATQHEMQILATLLNSQFGQAHVDQQQGLVMLQVIYLSMCCCCNYLCRLYNDMSYAVHWLCTLSYVDLPIIAAASLVKLKSTNSRAGS